MSQLVRTARRRIITVATPAVNTAISFTVPSGVRWSPVGGTYSLTTVPSTGQGYASVNFSDATFNTQWGWDSGQATGAGKTQYMYGARESGFYADANEPSISFSFPSLWLYPTDVIFFTWYGSTGDIQLDNAILTVEEQLLGY